MSMIKRITKKQLAKIPEYMDKWKKMALCTKPTNEDKATAAIHALYDNVELEKPSHILFLDSPFGCLLAQEGMEKLIETKKMKSIHSFWHKIIKSYRRGSNSGAGKVESDPYANVTKSLESHINKNGIPKELGCELAYLFWEEVDNYLHHRLLVKIENADYWKIRSEFHHNNNVGWEGMNRPDNTVFPEIHSNEIDFISALKNSVVSSFIHGPSLGLYEYCRDVLGIKYCSSIQPLIDATQECGWVLPYLNVCFVSRKPEAIHADARNRWHKFGGPALEYGDGWGVYAINGIRMPKKYANEMPEKWKTEWLLQTRNAEQRKVIISVIGYSKIMRDLGATLIHSNGDMSLHKITQDIDVEAIYLLKVKCPSTGTSYALRVPPHVKTCEDARMALMRNSKGKYTFAKET